MCYVILTLGNERQPHVLLGTRIYGFFKFLTHVQFLVSYLSETFTLFT